MLYDKRNVRNLLSVRFAYFNFIGNCISYKVKTLRGDATHAHSREAVVCRKRQHSARKESQSDSLFCNRIQSKL